MSRRSAAALRVKNEAVCVVARCPSLKQNTMALCRTNVADSFALGSSGFATNSSLHCADGACNASAEAALQLDMERPRAAARHSHTKTNSAKH
jgi:hypothetical protein